MRSLYSQVTKDLKGGSTGIFSRINNFSVTFLRVGLGRLKIRTLDVKRTQF